LCGCFEYLLPLLLQIDGSASDSTAGATLQSGVGKAAEKSRNANKPSSGSSSCPTGLCAYIEMKSLVVVVPPNAAAIAGRVVSRYVLASSQRTDVAWQKARCSRHLQMASCCDVQHVTPVLLSQEPTFQLPRACLYGVRSVWCLQVFTVPAAQPGVVCAANTACLCSSSCVVEACIHNRAGRVQTTRPTKQHAASP
jgi:hypothetical protein